jgi:hypothetical protein
VSIVPYLVKVDVAADEAAGAGRRSFPAPAGSEPFLNPSIYWAAQVVRV